ncbi:Oxygen regulatory protein NreC [Pseudobythopirellula maris]|uniref:Oxygen regulatory protein NreC n=1 Tax=Pseudobythopirellula maris TaxID=2527991 RepID=A0A5C5ZTE3_9BACT|nr:response regulator transcription factor [Pseudobythopirellula maris]TWT90345.1 Oxygen regulatory protein NreC [Pseudobythopirellula maris]
MSEVISAALNAISVMIVDDHPTVREGLARRIASQSDMSVCGEAADCVAALERYAQMRPDVVIVDLALKEGSGLDLIKDLHARHHNVRAVVHSMYDESFYADRALRAGAVGYVNKEADPDVVTDAIRVVMAGRVYLSETMTRQMLGRSCGKGDPFADPVATLTDRQLQIFRMIGEGSGTRQIAEQLHLSVHTVETHRENIKRKLGIASSGELARRAVLWGHQASS